ncbi:MAG: aldo/keto reductase [Thermoanaerobacteraceae bacterium]
MPKRKLGKTGKMLSIVGMGGIVVMNLEQTKANSIVEEAIERGVNYFDVAPSYGDAELKLGTALNGKRDKIFLACKTAERSREGAEKQLKESLKKLNTDYFDLYQLHGMTTEEDFKMALGPNGALEAIIKARDEGFVKYIGFSAHSSKIALRLMDAFNFDTILFPINWVAMINANFGPAVIEKAKSKDIGILAIKGMAMTLKEENDTRYPKAWYKLIENHELAKLAFRYTLSQPVTSALPPGDESFFPLALEVGENFTQIKKEEEKYLKEKSKGLKPIFDLDN